MIFYEMLAASVTHPSFNLAEMLQNVETAPRFDFGLKLVDVTMTTGWLNYIFPDNKY